MKKSIDYYISELLYTNDCVIIPGFGGFVGNPISATLDEENQILYPPSKQILFNKNITTNDGLLIHHIANQEGLTQKEVTKKIEKFKEEISRKLNEIKNFRLEKIGLLSVNDDNGLVFTQDTSINYSLESYGMSHVLSQPIVHESIEKEIKKDFKKIIKEDNTISYRKAWRAAAILIPLLGLSLISITQQDNITSIYTEMAKLSPFKNNSTAITIEKEIPSKNIIIKKPQKTEVLKKEVKIPIKKEEEIIAAAPQQYYQYHIVAGAFGNQTNADKLMFQLQKQNYNAKIIGKSSSGLIRVSYSSYKTKEEAVMALATIRKQNNSAWILSQ